MSPSKICISTLYESTNKRWTKIMVKMRQKRILGRFLPSFVVVINVLRKLTFLIVARVLYLSIFTF